MSKQSLLLSKQSERFYILLQCQNYQFVQPDHCTHVSPDILHMVLTIPSDVFFFIMRVRVRTSECLHHFFGFYVRFYVNLTQGAFEKKRHDEIKM